MDRDDGLRLLRELEEKERWSEAEDDAVDWWRSRYPEVPSMVWNFMKGQGRHWKSCSGALPWNRYKRRQIESARGVILHVFFGDKASKQRWKELEREGWVVLTLDILANVNEDLHSPALWAYLWNLAKEGKLKVLYGGPPCRSTSRLRHRQPGPRPLRGRGPRRFELEGLTDEERRLVHGDTALVFKMLGLYEVMKEGEKPGEEVAFLMEHPSDPEDYLDETEERDYPSVWNWPELKKFEEDYGLYRVKFDQGATGHVRRKPTTLCTSLEEMRQLDGLRATGAPKEEMKKELGERLAQSSSWAAWSDGLVAAVKLAIRNFLEETPSCRRFTMEEWRQHVRQGHTPYRRDCRACVEEMGQDRPHRRRKSSEAGESAYALSMDVIGPFKEGWDYARSSTAKYALVATIPVPVSDVEKATEEKGGLLQDLEEEEEECRVLEELLEEEGGTPARSTRCRERRGKEREEGRGREPDEDAVGHHAGDFGEPPVR